jgi:hypothetical protein
MPQVHKFVKWSCIGIFASNAPNPLHWTQNSSFGVFWTFLLLHESRCKTGPTGATNAQVCETKLHRNFVATNAPDPLHWTQKSSFRAFRTTSLPKIDAKWVELVPVAEPICLNYSGSSALVIIIQAILTQRTSNGTTHWSVESPPDSTAVTQDRGRFTSHEGEFTITPQLTNF